MDPYTRRKKNKAMEGDAIEYPSSFVDYTVLRTKLTKGQKRLGDFG